MQLPHPLLAVVFDMDGLLLATESVYRAAIFETSQRLGFVMTDAVHLSLVGIPRDRAESNLLAHYGGDFPLEAFDSGYRMRFEELCAEGIALRPGAAELLDELARRGLPAAVATSSPRAKAESHLQRAGILQHFRAVVGRSDVAHGKPSPETFLTAAARLGVDPHACLALEDSHNGVRAATAAGMATVMVPDLLPATDEMRQACVAVLDNLAQVIGLLPAHGG